MPPASRTELAPRYRPPTERSITPLTLARHDYQCLPGGAIRNIAGTHIAREDEDPKRDCPLSTAEVAQALGQFPGVIDVSVYGLHVPGHDGRAGCATLFLSPATGVATVDWDTFLQNACAKLPKYAVPVFLRLFSKPSLTGNAKQNKILLKKDGIDMNIVIQSAESTGTVMDKCYGGRQA